RNCHHSPLLPATRETLSGRSLASAQRRKNRFTSICCIVAMGAIPRHVPPTCLLIKLARPRWADSMESWLAGGWGEACVALTLIPRFTGAGGVESRSQARRVAHARSGMQRHEPPPRICRLFGVVCGANAV